MSLSHETINNIELKAREVLVDIQNEKGQIEIPINLGRILDKYQIILKSGNFDKEIVGAYEKKTRTILVQKSDPYERQAFTVAHELGHFFLHNDKEIEVYYRKDILNLNQAKDIEEEANLFAASLLMPEELILEYWNRINDIKNISALFGVSQMAMTYRLKNLGLINPA